MRASVCEFMCVCVPAACSSSEAAPSPPRYCYTAADHRKVRCQTRQHRPPQRAPPVEEGRAPGCEPVAALVGSGRSLSGPVGRPRLANGPTSPAHRNGWFAGPTHEDSREQCPRPALPPIGGPVRGVPRPRPAGVTALAGAFLGVLLVFGAEGLGVTTPRPGAQEAAILVGFGGACAGFGGARVPPRTSGGRSSRD